MSDRTAQLADAYRDLEDAVATAKDLFVILEGVVERTLEHPVPQCLLPDNEYFCSSDRKFYDLTSEDSEALITLLYTVGDKVRDLYRQYFAGFEQSEAPKDAA